MRTTFATMAALGAVCLTCACDQDKKPTETTAKTASATASAVPPPAPKAAPEELAQKAVKTLVDAWNAHDTAKIAAAYEPTGKLVISGMPQVAGHDALVTQAKDTFGSYSDFKVALTRELVHGNTIAAEWVITGKNDGPSAAGPATGRQMGVAGISVSTIDDDGLIREEHRYVDSPTIMSQLDPKAKAGTFRPVMALPAVPPEIIVSKATPNEAKALDVTKTAYTAFEGQKQADLLALVTDASTIDDYTMPATETGTKGVKEYVTGFWTAFPDATQTKPLQFAAGDYTVNEGVFTGTQKGAMGPIKPTNKTGTMHFVDVIQVKDGKVAHMDSFANSAELLVSLGVMKPIGQPPAASSAVAVAKPK
jgi:predicted ester cyclase